MDLGAGHDEPCTPPLAWLAARSAGGFLSRMSKQQDRACAAERSVQNPNRCSYMAPMCMCVFAALLRRSAGLHWRHCYRCYPLLKCPPSDDAARPAVAIAVAARRCCCCSPFIAVFACCCFCSTFGERMRCESPVSPCYRADHLLAAAAHVDRLVPPKALQREASKTPKLFFD